MPHAIRIHRTGPPEVLEWESSDRCSPAAGEALVQQHAIGVNFIDVYHRSGLYPVTLPSGIGMEAVGTVLAVAPGVTEVRPGDRVAYISGPPGSYAEERCVPAARLIPVPEDIDDRTAAALLLKGMTVEMLVRRVHRVERGETVLLHAAAGGVGLIACQWLRHLGARVIATVGSHEKAVLVRAHGATEVVVYTEEDFVARVKELTNGAGVPVVYDSVGKATFRRSLDCLARRGLLVCFGNASGKPEPFEVQELATRGSLFLTRPTLFHYTASRAELLSSAAELFAVVRAGAVRAHIGQEFALHDAARAHEALEARNTVGSTLLVPGAA